MKNTNLLIDFCKCQEFFSITSYPDTHFSPNKQDADALSPSVSLWSHDQRHLSSWRFFRRGLTLSDSADCFSLVCSQSRKLSCCFCRLETRGDKGQRCRFLGGDGSGEHLQTRCAPVQVTEERLHLFLPVVAVGSERGHLLLLLLQPGGELRLLLGGDLLAASLQLIFQLVQTSLFVL